MPESKLADTSDLRADAFSAVSYVGVRLASDAKCCESPRPNSVDLPSLGERRACLDERETIDAPVVSSSIQVHAVEGSPLSILRAELLYASAQNQLLEISIAEL